MREDHRPYQLLRNKFLVPVGIKVALVDFTGNLVRLHSMAGTGEGGEKLWTQQVSLLIFYYLYYSAPRGRLFSGSTYLHPINQSSFLALWIFFKMIRHTIRFHET